MISTPEEELCKIRLACERTINAGEDALAEKFVTNEDDATDLPEIRKMIEKAVSAAKVLVSHLESNYEFGSGFAEAKDGVCLE